MMRWHMKYVPPAYRPYNLREYFVDPSDQRTAGRVRNPSKHSTTGIRMQCTNYLKAFGLQLCLLLDFGEPRLEIKRVAYGL